MFAFWKPMLMSIWIVLWFSLHWSLNTNSCHDCNYWMNVYHSPRPCSCLFEFYKLCERETVWERDRADIHREWNKERMCVCVYVIRECVITWFKVLHIPCCLYCVKMYDKEPSVLIIAPFSILTSVFWNMVNQLTLTTKVGLSSLLSHRRSRNLTTISTAKYVDRKHHHQSLTQSSWNYFFTVSIKRCL